MKNKREEERVVTFKLIPDELKRIQQNLSPFYFSAYLGGKVVELKYFF